MRSVWRERSACSLRIVQLMSLMTKMLPAQ